VAGRKTGRKFPSQKMLLKKGGGKKKENVSAAVSEGSPSHTPGESRLYF